MAPIPKPDKEIKAVLELTSPAGNVGAAQRDLANIQPGRRRQGQCSAPLPAPQRRTMLADALPNNCRHTALILLLLQ